MRSFIVVGDEMQFQQYVCNFIKLNHIPSSLVFTYSDVFKVADARHVRTLLASRTRRDVSRLFVFPSHVTVEAQNALLKSIEELPSDTYIIIHSQTGGEFLPTILSRCSIIHLQKEEFGDTRQDIDLCFREYIVSGKNDSAFLLAEKISTLRKDELYSFFAFLSILMKEGVYNYHETQVLKTYKFLQLLFFYYPFLTNNNLNKRFTFEIIAIASL